jgi:galactoside O-acetyltransferase
MSFLTEEELAALGLASCGEDVKISRKTSIYGAERIAIGDHVRIDDFCVISAGAGGISIGSHVHIAVYV